jgi:hypothetical protein
MFFLPTLSDIHMKLQPGGSLYSGENPHFIGLADILGKP